MNLRHLSNIDLFTNYNRYKLEFFVSLMTLKLTSFIFHTSLLQLVEERESIRMYSNADISAMKIQAILGRAQKKDFWDLYELLKHYPLQQLIDWHKQKYPGQMLAISIPHALTYFADADESEPPVSFKNQTWESIKYGISRAVSDYLK